MNISFTGRRFCRSIIFKANPLIFLLFFFILITAYQPVFAQTGKVQGTIYNEKGNPLPDVTIKIGGTTTGTVSDQNGRFAINAKKGSVPCF